MRCNAAPGLQCAVLAMRWLQACPARLARCCTNATRCCNRGAVRAFAMQLQRRCLGFSCRPLPNTGASASLAAYGCIRCRVVTDAFQVVKPCFSLRTGFGPAANEMANGSGRRHYCASATTIGDCYIVKYLSVHKNYHNITPAVDATSRTGRGDPTAPRRTGGPPELRHSRGVSSSAGSPARPVPRP